MSLETNLDARPVSEPELEPTPPEVKRYQRQKLIASLIALALTLTVVLVTALWLGPLLDQQIRAVVGDSAWLRLIVLGFLYATMLELVTLPVSFWSGFLLEHREGLSKQTLPRWIWRQIKGYLVGGPLGLLLLLGFYTLLWTVGPWWWVVATACWLLVTLVLGQLMPVVILPLFYKVTPLEEPELQDRLKGLAEGTGLEIEGVYRLHLSTETRKANAALAGLGRARRVLLGDTLLEGFTPEEVEVVFAHEVGHHVHRHLPKMILMSVVLAGLGFFLVDRVLHLAAPWLGYASFDDPAALPLVLLVGVLFGLLLAPLQNAISRHFERQCDRYALERTGNVPAYRSAFAKLARMNKVDADPNPVVVWMFEDHPPIRERLALADTIPTSR